MQPRYDYLKGFETVKAMNSMAKTLPDQQKPSRQQIPLDDLQKRFVPQVLEVPKNKYTWTGLDMLRDSRARLQEVKSRESHHIRWFGRDRLH